MIHSARSIARSLATLSLLAAIVGCGGGKSSPSAGFPPLGDPPKYTVRAIGALTDQAPLGREIYGLNDNGQIVGVSLDSRLGPRGIIWNNGASNTPHILLDHGWVSAISDNGTAAGTELGADGGASAVMWTGNARIDLPTLHGYDWSRAESVNSVGYVVGTAQRGPDGARAVLWGPDHTPRDLGTLGGKWSSGAAINNLGQVAGISEASTGPRHAFIWQNGAMFDISQTSSRLEALSVVDINDRSQVLLSDMRGGFIWDNGHETDIGSLGSGASTCPYDINNRGQVVGGCGYSAVLWQNGKVHNLNDLLPEGSPHMCDAVAINDKGEIVCYAGYLGSYEGAYLLTPVSQK